MFQGQRDILLQFKKYTNNCFWPGAEEVKASKQNTYELCGAFWYKERVIMNHIMN